MGAVIWMFGSDSLSGATQVAMMVIAFFTALIGLKNGISWHEIEKSIVRSSTKTTGPILIFLSIGALIGSLMLSGAVPSLLYYGLNILSPTYFYPLTCLICALVAICIGSSWTTAATIGVALMGVSYGFALSPEITAGAIISGAYFGDKMSPLSETTNLAPSIAGSDLFEHIRHMAWVSVPSFVIAVFAFFAIGLNTAVTQGSQTSIDAFIQTLDQHFDISPINLIPVVLLLWLAVKKTPAFLAIIGVSLLACMFTLIFQYDVLLNFAGGSSAPLLFKSLWTVLFDGFSINTENESVNSLLSRGGMASMVNMAWLVIASKISVLPSIIVPESRSIILASTYFSNVETILLGSLPEAFIFSACKAIANKPDASRILVCLSSSLFACCNGFKLLAAIETNAAQTRQTKNTKPIVLIGVSFLLDIASKPPFDIPLNNKIVEKRGK